MGPAPGPELSAWVSTLCYELGLVDREETNKAYWIRVLSIICEWLSKHPFTKHLLLHLPVNCIPSLCSCRPLPPFPQLRMTYIPHFAWLVYVGSLFGQR